MKTGSHLRKAAAAALALCALTPSLATAQDITPLEVASARLISDTTSGQTRAAIATCLLSTTRASDPEQRFILGNWNQTAVGGLPDGHKIYKRAYVQAEIDAAGQYCRVEVNGLSTADMSAMLDSVLASLNWGMIPLFIVNANGCDTQELSMQPEVVVTVTLTGPEDTTVCTSPSGGAMVFERGATAG